MLSMCANVGVKRLERKSLVDIVGMQCFKFSNETYFLILRLSLLPELNLEFPLSERP